jgi:phosphoribosylamine--glycine ligase
VQVLVIGAGGREHALALALSRDPNVTAVHAAPGNPGMAAVSTLHDVDPVDGKAVAALAGELGVDLVVVGPEAPLVAGVADAVRAARISCFGPSADAARLEGSKAFAKEVMAAADVPTAMARVCASAEEAAHALDAFGPPYVVKDDGLAAGKGVVVTEDRDEALAHAAACERVVIEEYLDGPEVSLFAITDGTAVVPLLPAQDPTPAAWAPTRRCRGRPRGSSRRSPPGCSSRPSTRWPAAARRSPGCSTPGSPSPSGACGSWSSTRASATPRRSRCWRC